MALTRDFKDTIQARAQRDPAFRRGLFQEAIEAFLSNDTETGKLLLRDYVNATVGFEKLGAELHKSPKSLMRMLSSQGNPRADNLFAVVGHLRKQEGVAFTMRPESQPSNHVN
jgi:DNA-binding phage protein